MTANEVAKRLTSLRAGSVLTRADVECINHLLQSTKVANDLETLVMPLLKVKCGRKEASLSPDDVVSIKSTSGSSTLTTREGENWCTSHSMKSIEGIWQHIFVRIDRNTAIHRRSVRRVYSSKEGDYRLETTDGRCLIVSRRCYSKIRENLSK